jgi:hypothetical protein
MLLVHWIADFVCQPDWMTLNKSKQVEIVLLHTFFYFMILFIGLEIGTIWGAEYKNIFLINFVSHFAIDFVTSRLYARLWKDGERHWFFVLLGFDQFLHTSILIWSL